MHLNPKAKVSLRHWGADRNPVLIIDDLVLDPHHLVTQALAASWGPPQGTYYPGPNAPLPADYLPTLLSSLRLSLARAFGIAPHAPLAASGFFALATQPLAHLGPWQRIPHYDQLAPDHLAIVHYLSENQGGGTGFFRHIPSGFESLNDARRDAYLAQITAWLDTQSLSHFAGPRTTDYELLEAVDFRFNRAVIYPGNVLHCALFDGATLSPDPRTGRLTANSFVRPD